MYVAEKWRELEAMGIKKDAVDFLSKGSMQLSQDHLVLTDAGKLLADGIAAELFR